MGIVPAVVDGTIAINRVMHNTMWVPGHFHIYLLLGVVAMLFGFMYHLGTVSAGAADTALDRASFWMYVVGGLAFSAMFLASGAVSIPRRWAVHLEPWLVYDGLATMFALVVVAGVLVFVTKFLGRARKIAA